ncbi:MAG: adenylate/guanylate cyclase domain-containing protein, partial [Desulfobacteraceae bacterium]
GEELIETLDQLRKNVMAKNEAYLVLEKSNEELKEAKARLDQYNTELENKVEERTFELRKAQEELLQLNAELEAKVQTQVRQLERYKELRRYLSPKLAEQILSSDQGLGTEPERKLVTVIFTDIRGFSNLTDSIEPEEAFSVLNHYLAEMIKIVHDHDGTLNKITGDGLLIFFGDPVPVPDHAERAVRMAVAMQQRVDQLKEDWTQYGQDMGVGIGINTGFVTVGNVGSEIHRDYTIVGTQVNVAARLESLALAGQILISKRTHSKVHHLVRTDDVGEIQVKGIPRPVKVYSVLW